MWLLLVACAPDPVSGTAVADGFCAVCDTDGDGLSDGDEVDATYGVVTNPYRADSDDDGLSDGDELLVFGTSPVNADTDLDGLSDGDELLEYGTDPVRVDSDDDGVSDGAELEAGTDPVDPASY